MNVFRILASRTELYLIEAHVRAATADEAEAKFYGALENEEDALSWIQDLDSSDTDIHSIEPIPVEHEAVPSSTDRSVCLYCGGPVRWTGTSADESPTGKTIPGPWIHVRRPMAGEGLGF
jgi:hypothetical protein